MSKSRHAHAGGPWPLVGRQEELDRLRRLLADPLGRGLVLAGGAGVGKSRLASEGLDVAARAGLATVRVTGTRSASQLPLGALASFLPPDDGRKGSVVDDRSDLLRRATAALLDQARGRRLVLLVDDAHLLDGASATLVHQLAITNRAFVLATVRTGEPVPDPILALWKDGVVERLDVRGLHPTRLAELLVAALGGPVDRGAATYLVERCQGNVLFLRELVLGALSTAALSDQEGLWRLVGSLAPSDRVVELVEERLTNLSVAERELMELAALEEPLGRAALDALAAPALASLLERRGLLVTNLDGRRLEVRLAHPLYGDVLRAQIPAVRAEELTRSLAEVTESYGTRRREDTLRVATWRLQSGGGDPGLMLAAAKMARWRYDFPLAERLARAAEWSGSGFAASLLLAQVLSLQGRGLEAAKKLEVLAGEARTASEQGAVAVTTLDNFGFYMGRADDALRMADAAEARLEDAAWRDEVTARRSGFLYVTEGPRAAAAVAEQLLQRAGGPALVWACLTASMSLGRLGRLQGALQASALGLSASSTVAEPLPWYPWLHTFLRCEALSHGGRLIEAQATAQAEYQQALVERSTEAQAHFAWQLTRGVGERGDVGEAIPLGREAAALFREFGRQPFLRVVLSDLALALALAGLADEAAETLESSERLEVPVPGTQVDHLTARAWTAVAAGEPRRGRSLLEEAATLGEQMGDLVGRAGALHGIARLGHPRPVLPALVQLAGDVEGDLVAARLTHVRGLAEHDLALLSTVAETFAELGAHLLAAEAAADAVRAARRGGRDRTVVGAERRASELADRCPGAVTPALQSASQVIQLTRGERETALLAATGRSNKEIAIALHLSYRTVENQLHRTYEKLGISGRSELAGALGRKSGERS